jgi:hypothetical protein
MVMGYQAEDPLVTLSKRLERLEKRVAQLEKGRVTISVSLPEAPPQGDWPTRRFDFEKDFIS